MTTATVQIEEEILRQKFQLSGFRHGQKEIISSVIAGKDALAVLPTGGGKSLCYQFAAVWHKKLVIVVSPLIALMKDQVASLDRIGVAAGCLHSAQTEQEKLDVFRRMALGGAFVLYLSPERVAKPAFQRWVMNKDIALFALDEAHCISQWGHDFREEYGQLRILKQLRPDVPILALTASATPLVLNDIVRQLGLDKPARHIHGFYRNNLYYQVETVQEEEEKISYLLQALKQTPQGRVIIYCGTRKSTEQVAKQLGKFFPGVGYYHAGMGNEDRTQTQEAYAAGEIRILAATNAFGMGIDHPDVRLVVHFQMPANIDSLYQEMGRAGRDGAFSTCLMLYAKKDKGLQSFFIQRSDASTEIKSLRWRTLDALVAYAEGGECRHSEVLTYFQDSQRINTCGHCDTCAPMAVHRIQAPPADLQLEKIKKTRIRKKPDADSLAEESFDSGQKNRLSALKTWRKEKAKELDIAAFMVFSDKTLRHLVYSNPSSLTELEKVHGFGPVKLEQFGLDVLAELKSH